MSNDNEPIDWSKFSPATMFRDWVAKSEAQWSQSVSEMMKDPRASGVLNRQVDEARMMQRMFAEFAQGTLAMANLPSRSDVEAIDERMGRIEDGLAALSAEVVRLREALGPKAAAPAPSRTRRAPTPVAAKEVAASAPPTSKAATGAGERQRQDLTPTKSWAKSKAKARPDPSVVARRAKR